MNSPSLLSIVVPVFNAADHLERLVADISAIPDLSIELVLVDDFSTDGSAEIIRAIAARDPKVIALYHDHNQGAGVARNNGFARSTGRYVLFFDADDHLHADVLTEAIEQMEQLGANVAMFPYRYEREEGGSYTAMNVNDETVWSAYMSGHNMRLSPLTDVARLLGFSNYPWNKILRAEHFRGWGLRFGATKVNNDILGHWYSLLFAGQVLLINRVICTHVVHSSGDNLTNQHGRERLQLFDALEETYRLLASEAGMRQRYAHHFWDLVLRTANWARPRIAAEHLEEFNVRLQELILKMDLGDYTRMKTRKSPSTAQALTKFFFS